MSTTTISILTAIKRDAQRDRSAAFFIAIENGDSPQRAHYYSHPRAFYSPLQLAQRAATRSSFDHYSRVIRAAVAS